MTKPCPFCHLDPARILAEDALTVVYKDGFPVSPGHTVVITRRHVATLFEASEAEQLALLRSLARARAILDEAHRPDGYNIGINTGNEPELTAGLQPLDISGVDIPIDPPRMTPLSTGSPRRLRLLSMNCLHPTGSASSRSLISNA